MLLYNNQKISEEELSVGLSNRAFQYNDGFFETVIVQEGRLRFWASHLERIQEAAAALRLALPQYFYTPDFEDGLLQLAEKQHALERGRLKLKVWRAGAGLYTPQSNAADWLATVQPVSAAPLTPIQAGVCHSVRTSYSPLSFFKGPNAPLYVLASIEKQERKLDDLILLNPQQVAAELSVANLCWVDQGVLYTPALDTGCINGVMRRNILQWCGFKGVKVRQAYFGVERLLRADAVFAANVTGLRSIASIEGTEVNLHNTLLDDMKADLLG
ncbi:branched-chain amino acid aminotransferase/4-amino-4-deoxychorismate lyase [Pontibacter ummariensis]|uniref:branched-chain-amino-acid transaminase n=1 Tax=Pontibacter ummariensis TaxID=1610492 RepID=A0A239BRT3_9BACT|nr:aminotransferase class IV [Pontibacter ummariensis]PRY15680.1 branched-chain amino acid aminotransferase/4-amino-4-deoxychorismate lyase [Pontibacter ummariensis]SNS10128.1 branched-chain amino acid aminotransferase/4-amino-4-deoxychorismate lyase [Pontibacter ummariensis]